ncbi:Protein PELOTA 1 [Vitis vinifera]|uniref:Protein PELOTA 1 n=1 Tax=Vitis vinifera TaxID=29760 RepID=A0A438JRZ7_VITVI|nr:Protein PELOTA 1 [Vitis vinifera]
MKLVEEEKILPNSGGTINIVPEEPDDRWLLYNLISKGDVIVADTTRKTAFGRVRLTLEIKITAIDYDKVGSVIRVAGRNLVHNEHVDAGAFHTIEIERNKPFDLKKKAWDSDAIEELRSYGNAAKADLAVLLIQDVSAELYSIGKIATTLCANIEAPSKTNLNKNRAAKSKSQSKSNKFFENILTEFVKITRRQKLQQIEENKERVVVVNTSGKATLKAVLHEPEVMKLIRGKNGAVEITAWKDFDELYRSANHGSRHKYTDLVKSVKKAGGKALVYSHNHVMGEQLGQLTGIAAILRFPLPDLDDMEL